MSDLCFPTSPHPLPINVQAHLLRYLGNEQERLKLRLVSKNWHRWITTAPPYCYDFEAVLKSRKPTNLLSTGPIHDFSLPKLQFENFKALMLECKNLSKKGLETLGQLLSKNKTLTSIFLDGENINKEELCKLASHFPVSLKRFSHSSPPRIPSNSFNKDQLEVFEEKSHHLNLSHCPSLRGDSVIELISSLPNLEELSCNVSKFSDQEFEKLCTLLPQSLTKLVFSGNFKSNWFLTLQKCIPYPLPFLSCIDLTQCSGLVDITLREAQDGLALQLTAALPETIKIFTLSPSSPLSTRGLSKVLEQLPSTLEEYFLRGAPLDGAGAKHLAIKLKNCRKLDLSHCKKLLPEKWGALLENLATCEELDLSASSLGNGSFPDTFTNKNSSTLNKLKILKINDCQQLSTKDWENLFQSLPSSLSQVSLNKATFDDTVAPLLASKLSHCVDLSLSDCWELSADGWQKIFQELPSLKKINLTNAAFDDEGALKLSEKLSTCVHLNLSGCLTLSSKGWEVIFKKITSETKEFHLNNTSIDDNAVEHFPKFKKVNQLDLSGSTALTALGWEDLFKIFNNKFINELNLSNNSFEKVTSFPSIHCQKLNLSSCAPPSAGDAKGWTTVFQTFSHSLSELDLSINSLTDDNAVSFPVHLKKLKVIHLNGCSLSSVGWKSMFEKLHNITQIALADTSFDDEAAFALAWKLLELKECLKLNLSGCQGPSSKGWSLMLRLLPKNLEELQLKGSSFETCVEVNLHGCKASLPVWKSILESLPYYVEAFDIGNSSFNGSLMPCLPTLPECKVLKLSANNFSIKNLNSLFESCVNSLVELSVTGMNFTEEGAHLFSKKLSQMKKLSRLDLADCVIPSSKGRQEIFQVLPKTLEKLSLKANFIDDESAPFFPKFLQLTELDLDHCKGLSQKGWKTVLESLPQTLRTLSLADSSLDDESVYFFPRFSQLFDLDLSGYMNFSSKSWKTILAKLPETLRTLSLANSSLDDASTDFFPKLSQLLDIHLKGCEKLSDRGWDKVSEMLPKTITNPFSKHFPS